MKPIGVWSLKAVLMCNIVCLCNNIQLHWLYGGTANGTVGWNVLKKGAFVIVF
jgi:hypothetical protein